MSMLTLWDPCLNPKGTPILFTYVDKFSRWPEEIPNKDATAEPCAQALDIVWISHFGIPVTITADQGRQFESGLWHEHMELTTLRLMA